MVVINDTYFVDIDAYNYTLKRKTLGKNKEGEPIETVKTIGYYSDLKQCINGALKDDCASKLKEGRHTLTEAIRVIDNSIKEFTELLEKLVKEEV